MKVTRRTIYLYGLVAVLLVVGFFIWLWRAGSIKESGESKPAYGPIRDSTHDVAGQTAAPMPDRPPVVEGSNISDEMLHEMLDEIVARVNEEFYGKPKAEIKADWIRHLNRIVPRDKERFARFDIPEEQLSTTPTDMLCWHFVSSRMTGPMLLYDNPNIGILRCILASRTLSTLISREDMIEGMIKMYSEVPIEEPEKKHHQRPKRISWALKAADELMMFPPIFEKTKGHEKELLFHLCQRYRRMVRVNERYESMGKKPPYVLVFHTTRLLTLRLVQNLDPQVYDGWKDSSIGDELLLSKTIEQILSHYE